MEHMRQYLYDRIQKTDTCWWWKGPVKNNYGKATCRPNEWLAHRLSYELHNGPIPEGFLVRHTCDNKLCVNPSHLIVGTHQDNADDAGERGQRARGARIAQCVLSEEEVRQIRDLIHHGIFSLRKLGPLYGVSYSTIRDIAVRKNWKHI